MSSKETYEERVMFQRVITEIMINDKADAVIKKPFKAFLSRY